MTFRNRRGRAQAYAAKHNSTRSASNQNDDHKLYETLQRHRRHRGVSRPLLACLLFLWFFRKNIWLRSGNFRAADMDPTNVSLQRNIQKWYFRNPHAVPGPETVVVGRKNQLFVLTEHGSLVELLVNEKKKKRASNNNALDPMTVDTKVWKDLGTGRPLGGRFSPQENTLYIADAALGLTRLKQYDNPKSQVELVTNTVTVSTEEGTLHESPLRYVNAIAIGPKTGNIYFTDSTDIAPPRVYKDGHWVWDTMYASKLDLIRGQPMGRVCEYNPKTNKVRVLAENIHFANGIAVDPVHEQWLVVAETFGTRLLQYTLPPSTTTWLKPSEYLQPHRLVDADQMTGYLDNVDCAVVNKSTYCFGAIVNSFAPIHRFLMKIPPPMDRLIRTLLWHLPRSIAPKVVPTYTGVVRVDMATRQIDYIQDPTASHVQMISGVTVHQNQLYLGSLTNDHIVVYDLEQGRT